MTLLGALALVDNWNHLEDKWKRHTVNYIIKESGIRQFCSQCADCCIVCKKGDRGIGNVPEGCRNSTCLYWLCNPLRQFLNKTELMKFLEDMDWKDSRIFTVESLREAIKIIQRDKGETKEKLMQLAADIHTKKKLEEECENNLRNRMLGIDRVAYGKKVEVCMTNIRLARNFDKETDRLAKIIINKEVKYEM